VVALIASLPRGTHRLEVGQVFQRLASSGTHETSRYGHLLRENYRCEVARSRCTA
jgi:hypothetical protein